jgi:peptidoglycan hydrolase-like protein with peptidoglycan-binding domain
MAKSIALVALLAAMCLNVAPAAAQSGQVREMKSASAAVRLLQQGNEVAITIATPASFGSSAGSLSCSAPLDSKSNRFFTACVGPGDRLWVSGSLNSVQLSRNGKTVAAFDIVPPLRPAVAEAPPPVAEPVAQGQKVACGSVPVTGFAFRDCARIAPDSGVRSEAIWRLALIEADSMIVLSYARRDGSAPFRNPDTEGALLAEFRADPALREFLQDMGMVGSVRNELGDRFFGFQKGGRIECKGFVRLGDGREGTESASSIARGLFCRRSDTALATEEIRFITDQLSFAGAVSPARRAQADAEAGEQALGLSVADRQKLQEALTAQGFDTHGTDGAFGPRTREVVAAWQKARGMPPTGFLDAAQREALLAPASAPSVPVPAPAPTKLASGTLSLCEQNVSYDITAPAADVPEAVAAFVGLWDGSWGNTLCSALIVSFVAADGTARATYVVGPNIYGGAGASSYTGKIVDGTLTLRGGATITFRATGNSSLDGRYSRTGYQTTGTFRRREVPVAAVVSSTPAAAAPPAPSVPSPSGGTSPGEAVASIDKVRGNCQDSHVNYRLRLSPGKVAVLLADEWRDMPVDSKGAFSSDVIMSRKTRERFKILGSVSPNRLRVENWTAFCTWEGGF